MGDIDIARSRDIVSLQPCVPVVDVVARRSRSESPIAAPLGGASWKPKIVEQRRPSDFEHIQAVVPEMALRYGGTRYSSRKGPTALGPCMSSHLALLMKTGIIQLQVAKTMPE